MTKPLINLPSMEIRELQQAVAEKDAALLQMKEDSKEKDAAILQMKEDSKEKDAYIAELEQKVAALLAT